MASLFDLIKNNIIGSDNTNKTKLYSILQNAGVNFNEEELNLLTENFQYLKDVVERANNALSKLKGTQEAIKDLEDEINDTIKKKNRAKSATIKDKIDKEIQAKEKRLKELRRQEARDEAEERKIRVEQERFRTRQTKKGYKGESVDNIYKITDDSDKYKALLEAELELALARQEEAKLQEANNKKIEAYNKTLNILNKDGITLASEGFDKSHKTLGPLGAFLTVTVQRFMALSDKLVHFNRQMGLGMSSSSLLGSDLYANNRSYGNLQTLVESQNLNFDDFLASYQAFKDGSLAGIEDISTQKKDLLDFGQETARLTKFYGVSMDTLTSSANNLIYNFGASVKDVNKTFETAKKTALSANVNVQKFFNNLQEATDLIGEYFIKGGINGMNQLALVATRLGMTTKEIVSSLNRYKTIHSQMELMNRASALGLGNTARNTRKIWALRYQGRADEAISTENISLARDLTNLGRIRDGQIDTGGLMMLEQMGYDKSQIESINRLAKMYKDLSVHGITYEMLTGLQKTNAEQEALIKSYERNNQTAGEKLNTAWTTIKNSVLDPLGAVLAPVFDSTLDGIEVFGRVVGKIAKFLAPGFQVLANAISKVTSLFSDFFDWGSGFLEKFGFKRDEQTGEISMTATIASTVTALLSTGLLMKVILKMFPFGKVISLILGKGKGFLGKGGGLSNIGNVTNNFLGKGKGLLGKGKGILGKGLNAGKGLLGALLGNSSAIKGVSPNLLKGLRGGVAGIAGTLAGSFVGGKAGETISNVAGFAGTSAMIGSMVGGPIGATVGAIIGGVGGLIYDSWDGITKVWQDESKDVWQKIGGTFGELWNNIKEAIMGLFSSIKEWVSKAWNTVKNTVSGAWNKVTGFASDVYNGFKENGFSGAWNVLKDGASNAWGALKDTAIKAHVWAFRPLIGIISGFKDVVKDGTKEGMIEANAHINSRGKNSIDLNAIAQERNKELKGIMKTREKLVDEGQLTAERSSNKDRQQPEVKVYVNPKIGMLGNEVKGGMY